jgi:hypothetical protein
MFVRKKLMNPPREEPFSESPTTIYVNLAGTLWKLRLGPVFAGKTLLPMIGMKNILWAFLIKLAKREKFKYGGNFPYSIFPVF